jgi:uncharacterized membrane protein YcaP (DUF421 family)
MLIVFIRAVILYAALILGIRLMGKRQIGELQPSELVTAVLLSNIASLPVEDPAIPMIIGIIPIFTLICLDVIMSYASLRFRGIRRLVCGSSKIVITNGKIHQKELLRLRYSADDLLESLRAMGIFDIDEVQLAVVETNGSLSVYQKFANRPVTNKDLDLKGEKDKDPPMMVIENGTFIDSALQAVGLSRASVSQELSDKGTDINTIYICTADPDGIVNIIEKEETQ